MKLTAHRYGKGRVRVMKVLRDGPVHSIKELTVSIALQGNFESSFTSAENALVVPTDTMKNTVNVLAHEFLGPENEPFALKLAAHFLAKYQQVDHVTVELQERLWGRLRFEGKPHPHSFAQAESETPFTRLTLSRDGARQHESGVSDFVILKSTGSGFCDYPKCDLTTLPETKDRVLATRLSATWTWRTDAADYRGAHSTIIKAMLTPFARNYSVSVQATLWEMGQAALKACPEITQISLAMPNLHYLPIDLTPFGRENKNEVFTPIDEPHGQIEATITRE